MRSPFDVTKAVDLADPEIERTFIAFRGQNRSIVDPASPMPQFLTGMKGGGRTHLMRHYSYPLQKTRADDRPLDQVKSDGYLGVYFRCSGLNGSRFFGKGQSPDTWRVIFAYYMDLWIAELLIATLQDLNGRIEWSPEDEARVAQVAALSLKTPCPRFDTEQRPFDWVLALLSRLRSDVDRAVNNAAHTRELRADVRANAGELIFRTCRAASGLPGMENVQITFLADEYENLTVEQQIYFNTLIREKEAPATFLVGGRYWGIRTHQTMSAGEENKKGSEFEISTIEKVYARSPKAYEQFCRELVSVRLREYGLSSEGAADWISRLSFAEDDRFLNKRLKGVLSRFTPEERPHLVRLKANITKVRNSEVAQDVASVLSFPDNPLLEKLAILRFYQAWAAGRQPSTEAARAARLWVVPLADGRESADLANFFKQRKSDAVAQIYREANRNSVNAGFRQLVDMSGYLPRSLLMILKYVTHWASFNGEHVFNGAEPLSESALSEGMRDAAQWYFEDAKPLGAKGVECHIAVTRLGRYLQSIRYSDKPSEINVTTFSTNLDSISEEGLSVLKRCTDHGLLVQVPGRTSRNHGSTHSKFQLHPMLTPLWGLSSGRRGDATLSLDAVEAIFNPGVGELPFRRVHEAVQLELNAPFSVATDSRTPLF